MKQNFLAFLFVVLMGAAGALLVTKDMADNLGAACKTQKYGWRRR